MVNSGAKVVKNAKGHEYLVIWDSGDVRIFTASGSYIFGGNTVSYTHLTLPTN